MASLVKGLVPSAWAAVKVRPRIRAMKQRLRTDIGNSPGMFMVRTARAISADCARYGQSTPPICDERRVQSVPDPAEEPA